MEVSIFKEEHNLFRSTVRKFVQSELNPLAEEYEEKEGFPKQIMKKLGELGCLGIRFPSEYGGMEADVLMTVVFVEEIARCNSLGIAMSVLSHTDMSITHINNLGTEEQKKRYLVPAIEGEILAGIAVTEPNHGSDVASIATTAQRKEGFYIVNGSKMFITNAIQGDILILAAKTNPEAGYQGISLFIFETSTPGYEVGKKLKKMAWRASDTGLVYFDNCRVPAQNLLGEEGKGFFGLMRGFENERLVLATAAISGAQRAFEESLNYARQRTQFGRPIGRFQVIAHKLVDMATYLEAGRQLVYRVAILSDAGVECRKEVMMAKLFCTEIVNKVAGDAVQIHGGYGLMEEFIVSRLYRDLRVFSVGGGTSEIMRGALAKQIGLGSLNPGF